MPRIRIFLQVSNTMPPATSELVPIMSTVSSPPNNILAHPLMPLLNPPSASRQYKNSTDQTISPRSASRPVNGTAQANRARFIVGTVFAGIIAGALLVIVIHKMRDWLYRRNIVRNARKKTRLKWFGWSEGMSKSRGRDPAAAMDETKEVA